jgi:hypothetical protein
MLDVILEAQTKFQEIDHLLRTAGAKDDDYFTRLSEATQNAYVIMNEGMCKNTTVCHECAAHRDFLHSMIGIVEDLASGTPVSSAVQTRLDLYAEKVSEILAKIKGAISAM